MAYSREAKKADKDIGTVLGGKEIKKLDADYDVYSSWQIQLLQLVDGLNVWLDYIDQPLVCTNLELIHGFFVDVGGTVHGVFLDASWQRYRSADSGSGAFCGIHDIGGRLIDHTVIVTFELNTYSLVGHMDSLWRSVWKSGASRFSTVLLHDFL